MKLSDTDKDSLEGQLTPSECKKALQQLAVGKTPGMDGLTSDFYRAFWEQIGHLVLNSLNEAYSKGEFMLAQNRGVIRLLPKPNEKREHLLKLENWRPISLLNVDYKIGSKALAMRLEKVLPKIIHSDQAGFVTGHFIGECIRTIDDVLYFTDYRKQPGIALFLDFSKAFDSLEHPFIYNSLKAFNFGDSFIRWFKPFYSNANSCIINNGYTSEYFSIERGVMRQGDPLSEALFVIAVELLAKSLRSNKNIEGIPVDGAFILISQYADDTTVFVEDEQSAEEVFRTLELFKEVSGLSLNKSKCEGRWLGTLKHCRLKPFSILWPEKLTCALGVHFSYNQEQTNRLNFDDNIEKLDKTLNTERAYKRLSHAPF